MKTQVIRQESIRLLLVRPRMVLVAVARPDLEDAVHGRGLDEPLESELAGWLCVHDLLDFCEDTIVDADLSWRGFIAKTAEARFITLPTAP